EPEHDFLVASLDGATGAERWRLVRNGTPGPPDPDDADWDDTSDEATALALAPGGDVIACGYLRNVETAPTGRWCGSPATPASSGGATWSTEPRTDRTWQKRSPSMHLATCWSPARCRPRPRAGKSWSRGSTVPAASKGGAASRWRRSPAPTAATSPSFRDPPGSDSLSAYPRCSSRSALLSSSSSSVSNEIVR